MEKAIRRTEANGLPIKFDVEFKPFRLDPTLSEDVAVDKQQRYLAKFGPTRLGELKNMICARGSEVGIDFNWNGVVRQTSNSHRLVRHAYEKQKVSNRDGKITTGVDGVHVKLLEEIFQGFFERAEDIGDPEVLGGYCERVGLMTKDETIAFLSGPGQRQEIEEHFKEARALGITGVPHTVINSRWAIVGGQTSDVYYKVFEMLAKQ